MIYEIINPSDACTVEADDDIAAAVAILYLSSGKYGLADEKGDSVLPILAFGGDEALNEWSSNVGIKSPSDYLDANREKIADCLQSFIYGSIGERKTFFEVTEELSDEQRATALDKWNKNKRGSMTDIGKAAYSLANFFRKSDPASHDSTPDASR